MKAPWKSSAIKRRDDDDDDESGDDVAMPVGLAENPAGVKFQCGTCEWFDNGTCRNKNPGVNGKQVKAEWCCNLFDRDDMKIIVR